jgi:glycosyltransferase involved in cell wall biosynthesis
MMAESKLQKISVIIPTKNSAKTLPLCLRSIRAQDYPQDRVEIIIVDGYSTDSTVDIAKRFGCKIMFSNARPLGARYDGFTQSSGEIIVLLDADHIICRKNLFIQISTMLAQYDMLHLQESSYNPSTFIQKLIDADKKSMQRISRSFNLLEGVLYARAYKREVLEKAYQCIPRDALKLVHNHEEIILHYEVCKLTKKHATVPDALWHIDETCLIDYCRKMMYYGQQDQIEKRFKQYIAAIRLKERFRVRELPYLVLSPKEGAKVFTLLAIKAIFFSLGKFLACTKSGQRR